MKAVIKDPLETSRYIETPMSISEYNVNEKFEDIKATINFIINLIYMTPGTIPEMPRMGYDLRARHHYLLTEDNIFEHEQDLKDQIRTYCNVPSFADAKLYPSFNEKTGDYDSTTIEISFLTGEVARISDEGYGEKLSVDIIKGKDFSK